MARQKDLKISKIGIDHHPGLQAMVLVFADKGDNYEESLQRGKVTLLQFNDDQTINHNLETTPCSNKDPFRVVPPPSR